MKVNELGLNLIHSSEGLASTVPNSDARVRGRYPKIASPSQLKNPDLILYPYLDVVGVKTIGWGHTLSFTTNPNAYKGGVTKQFCDDLFSKEIGKYEDGVAKFIKVNLNENQFSALVSFCYNAGVGSLQISQLRKRINENPNDFDVIKREFLKWNKAKGVIIPALTKRRLAEFELYKLEPVEKKAACSVGDEDSDLIVV